MLEYMSNKKNISVCIICCTMICASKANIKIPLVKNGKNNYSISISTSAAIPVKKAIEDILLLGK
jgi:Tfp pilus assembly major pilin PilA